MPLQLSGYTDRFDNSYATAYARIEQITTPIPTSGLVETLVRIYKDAAAQAAGADYVFEEYRQLAFNPFSATAANDAYTALSQEGGIYTGSTIV